MENVVIERTTMTSALWVEVLKWRNDPKVYTWNRTNRIINLDEHIAWFENRKSNLDHEPIFAYFSESSFVGTARLDRTSSQVYEIGILVNPRFRGVGYGRAILGNLCSYMSSEKFDFFDITASVHVDNVFSRSLFESFNFIHKSRVGFFDILQWAPPRFQNNV